MTSTFVINPIKKKQEQLYSLVENGKYPKFKKLAACRHKVVLKISQYLFVM